MASRTLRALPRPTPRSYTPVRWTSSKPPPPPSPTPDAHSVLEPPKDKDGTYVVPPLSKPPGIPFPPTTDPVTWARRREQLMDTERRRAERKLLIKEASQGYFHDYNLARKANGGKLWVGPPVLIREDKMANYFPDISGKALTGETVHTTDLLRGKVSLVSILNTRISEEHVQSFVAPVLEDWEGQPAFRYMSINHQDNALKSMLVSFFVSGLKRTVPQERWGSYIFASGEWSKIDITGPLGIDNKILGYVYLVDENAKIRWAGCAMAQPKEAEDLRRAAAVLMRRKLDH
ncbi:uncharacterized protein CcaverHIS019_0602550 [Cutaneotrichosporon cavernicola]|uniref:Uncharacterized protein n=1 Tax=Cutaneotrichosporon cavernicola TaxID=279322 RepID=A0AA48QXW4_9TREE|nr:uncharacterized protein CcaverHIS019_0602550 [Cutaneotrichosporon cavernicola]BEI93796.1 hypothetical protein CcaverHIS019_0602550 [Cutaneotrichosporon cavernicola]